MKPNEERASLLYDYAVSRPDGFTNQQAMAELGWSHDHFTRAVRVLRDILGEDDDINLTCEPNGCRQDWIYRLVGDYDGAQPWATNRLRDAERRLTTIEHVTAPVVRTTDGRTIVGRKARMLNSTARYVKEQLQLLGLDEQDT